VPLILLLLLTGCGKGTTTPGKGSTGDGPKTTTTTSAKKPDLDPKAIVHKGHTLDVWATNLMKGSDIESYTAAVELGEVGEPALPYFIKAMESDRPKVKYFTLQQLQKGKAWARNHDKELVPVLNKAMSRDEHAIEVRREAAITVGVLQFPESVVALGKSRDAEPDPGTKDKMTEILKELKKS
jgi:hypothetical protein